MKAKLRFLGLAMVLVTNNVQAGTSDEQTNYSFSKNLNGHMRSRSLDYYQSESTLIADGGWQEFDYGGVNSPWSDTFSFELVEPAVLTVTDAFCAGDRLKVVKNGVFLGRTSKAATDLSCDTWTNDYNTAAADPRWSTGVFSLDP